MGMQPTRQMSLQLAEQYFPLALYCQKQHGTAHSIVLIFIITTETLKPYQLDGSVVECFR